MKTVLITLLLIIMVVIALFVLGKKSASGQPPGLLDNQLTHCPQTPNCACTEYSDDIDHYIEPFRANTKIDTVSIAKVIESLEGKVLTRTDFYLAAIFTSKWFHFVDDVEIRILPEKGIVHIRSASRVGHGDMGVNKKRVEKIKELLRAAE